MWILQVMKPETKGDFTDLCRRHGLTMADVRFEEARAMAGRLRAVGKYPA